MMLFSVYVNSSFAFNGIQQKQQQHQQQLSSLY